MVIANTSPYIARRIPPQRSAIAAPSGLIEYGYYAYLSYVVMGGVFGLEASNLASAMLAALFGLCLLQLRFRSLDVIGLAAFPLYCGATYILIQLVFHGESILDGYVQPFVPWLFSVVLIQALSLRHKFLHRFALVTFFLGLGFLPFLEVSTQAGSYQRIAMNRGIAFSHTNSMAAWYGYCAVYFIVLSYTTRRMAVRILTFLLSMGCIYMVTLTVSRGALFAIAVAIVIASRHLLKKGFLPILLVAGLGWSLVALGIFDDAIRAYGARGTEETGRFLVWPLVLERILHSPIVGVGASNLPTVVSEAGRITPHNGFLFVALASGIIPGALFVAYWYRAAWTAFQARSNHPSDEAFYLPLLAYAFLIVSSGNMDFMVPWVVVSLAVPVMASLGLRQIQGAVQVGQRTPLGPRGKSVAHS
jgi:O-antigen ligase